MDPVDVANLALGHLGLPPIADIDGSDGTPAGQLMSRQFPGLRDAVTEDRDWTFATKRLQLNRVAGEPPWGWTSQFLLSAEVLRVITCADASTSGGLDAFAISMALEDGVDVTKLEWAKEGQYVVTREGGAPIAKLNVKAIVQVPDSSIWTPSFCQVLAARLAAELCVPLTNSRSLLADLWKLYAQKLRDAAANDGRQGRMQHRVSSTLANRRR